VTYLRAEHTALDEIAYRRAVAILAVADSRLVSDLKGFLELFTTTTGVYGDFEMPWGFSQGFMPSAPVVHTEWLTKGLGGDNRE